MTSPREIEIKDNREDIPFKYSITSYGADYDVAGLVRRIRQGDVYVPAFQRGFLWTIEDASRFIESPIRITCAWCLFCSRSRNEQVTRH